MASILVCAVLSVWSSLFRVVKRVSRGALLSTAGAGKPNRPAEQPRTAPSRRSQCGRKVRPSLHSARSSQQAERNARPSHFYCALSSAAKCKSGRRLRSLLRKAKEGSLIHYKATNLATPTLHFVPTAQMEILLEIQAKILLRVELQCYTLRSC